MTKLKEWCQEISDVVIAAANCERIQISCDGKTWGDKTELAFDSGYKYRIKPRTIKIGDFDVPEPMRVPPSAGTTVFSVSLELIGSHDEWDWIDGDCVMDLMLSRGILHSSRESAIAHAKALIALTAEK